MFLGPDVSGDIGRQAQSPGALVWRQKCGCHEEEPVPEARREKRLAWREHSGGTHAWPVGSGRQEPIPRGVGPVHGERSQGRDLWGIWVAQSPLARTLGFLSLLCQATHSCRHPNHAGSLLLSLSRASP